MDKLKIVIPKGRLNKKVTQLLNEAGLGIETGERCYIPRVKAPDVEVKLMKPQNIPQLVEIGAHDIGFTGLDWIIETGSKVSEVMDLGTDPVKIVAAVPESYSENELQKRKIVVASEYENITRRYLQSRGFDYYFIRTYGATEVFPPDDADMIIDNMSSGLTLQQHNLKVIDRLNHSTTRMIANPKALEDPWKKSKIDELALMIKATLDAEDRVMIEMNIPPDSLEALVTELPCMRAPTVAPLYAGGGYAVKIVVRKNEAPVLIPGLKAMGASDILEYSIRRVVI